MGASREGYCKLCKHAMTPALNKLISDDNNEAQCARAMLPLGLKWTRATFYKHKEHITSPLLTAVDKARQNPVIVPKTTTAVLESIREIGMRNVMEHPEEVTVDHTLKAASILQQSEKKGDGVLVVLAKMVMADLPDDVAGYIEGEYEEVTDEV